MVARVLRCIAWPAALPVTTPWNKSRRWKYRLVCYWTRDTAAGVGFIFTAARWGFRFWPLSLGGSVLEAMLQMAMFLSALSGLTKTFPPEATMTEDSVPQSPNTLHPRTSHRGHYHWDYATRTDKQTVELPLLCFAVSSTCVTLCIPWICFRPSIFIS